MASNIVREHDGSLWLEITEQQAENIKEREAIVAREKEKLDTNKKNFPVGTRVVIEQ